MIAVFVWVALSIVVGWAGAQKGRSGIGFLLLSLLLSPLIGILVVIAVPRVERAKAPLKEHAGQKKCTSCAEWILIDAKKCKHCGEPQPEPSPQQLLAAEPAAVSPRGSAFPWLILILMTAVAIWALSSERARAETTITDGDTIRLNDAPVRLFGIDAPESRQWCGDYPAGAIATGVLASLIRGREVTCEPKTTDRFGRLVAVCRADGRDLGKAMVRQGAALAFTRYSADYLADEEAARSEELGVHGRGCETPWQWRAAQRK